jgi:hypothetical protein
MITTKVVKVYASTRTSTISTHMEDFLHVAIDEGDIEAFGSWLADEYDVSTLFDFFEEYPTLSAGEVCSELRERYLKESRERLTDLFDCGTDYWCDTIEVEVEVTMNSNLDLEVKVEAV